VAALGSQEEITGDGSIGSGRFFEGTYTPLF